MGKDRIVRDVLTTERLILRPYEESDAESLYQYAKDPLVGPVAGWAPHESVESSLEIIRDLFFPSGAWAIVLKETGEHIGTIALEEDRRRPDIPSKEIGYSLASKYWGRGIMTEACKEVVRYAFQELDLYILAICTSRTNERSAGVIENCGFKQEGTERACYCIYDGSFRDSRIYSLLKSEWLELTGR